MDISVNPFVFELNKFNTQNAEQLNAYDELSTIDLDISIDLDRLIDEMEKAPFRIVILTGDAGDGKTRFCRKLIDRYKGVTIPSEIGWKESIIQPRINIYKDASAVNPDDMRKELIAIQRELISGVGLTCHNVIAVNEGKLRDLCDVNDLRVMWDEIRKQLDLSMVEYTSDLAVINLNQRNIAAGESVDKSIIEKAILSVTNPVYWEERESKQERCSNCSKSSYCSIFGNVKELRKEIVRERLWQLFIINSYLDPGTENSHITIRGLLSSLSYIVTGNLDCVNIDQENYRPYFSNIFSKYGNSVIRQLCRIDTAKTSNLEIDQQIYSEFSDIDDEEERIEKLNTKKREFYFTESSTQKALNLLPFKFFQDFRDIASGKWVNDERVNSVIKRLLRALNCLESPHSNNDFLEQWFIGQIKDGSKYRIIQGNEISSSDFELKTNDKSLPYIETQANRLRLCWKSDPSIEPLEIDLLLYELLNAYGRWLYF